MLKACLHLHTQGDLQDSINYSPEEAIKKAAKLNFDVVSITCHDTIIFSEELALYAQKRGILLIPGIEKEIEGKHVLIINAQKASEKIETFEELKIYKKEHPQCAIIAPHPFHLQKPLIHPRSLGNTLIKHIDLFDAIEYNSYYLAHLDFNKKALKTAKEYNKPVVGTSDIHTLKYFDKTYTLIESEKNTKKIIQAIKQNKVKLVTTPLTTLELLDLSTQCFIKIPIRNLRRRREMVELVKK